MCPVSLSSCPACYRSITIWRYLALPVYEAGEVPCLGRDVRAQVLQQFQELRSEIWHVIDAARPPDDVAQHIRAAVGPVLDAARSGAPLALLWEHPGER